MLAPTTMALRLVAIWTLAAIALSWSQFDAFWRRTLALLASGAGLVFLILALNAAGQREAPTTGTFLLGPATIVGKVSASASLPYYVMTGFCLLLGTTGLALSERTARKAADHWLAAAVCLSLLVTLLRFLLELAAAPLSWTWSAGITALAPIVGAFFAIRLRAEGRTLPQIALSLPLSLVLYAIMVRGFVVVLMAVATSFGLGSHYDVSAWTHVASPVTGRVSEFAPGGLRQILYIGVLPQLLFWPVYTVVAGFLGGAVASVVAAVSRGRLRSPRPAVEIAVARQDS
jgi:hypothetical protein